MPETTENQVKDETWMDKSVILSDISSVKFNQDEPVQGRNEAEDIGAGKESSSSITGHLFPLGSSIITLLYIEDQELDSYGLGGNEMSTPLDYSSGNKPLDKKHHTRTNLLQVQNLDQINLMPAKKTRAKS